MWLDILLNKDNNLITVRLATQHDWDSIWPFFKSIVRAGETYAFDTQISRLDALDLWVKNPRETYVVEEQGKILGSYYLKTNFQGNAAHTCNCGFMVASEARGKGVASLMCEHSQQRAIELGYKAMQFNFVVSTNEGAVRLWKKLGFNIVGSVPKAFNHPAKGLVDAYVLHKWLV